MTGNDASLIPCFRCGTCCTAADISTLRKPLGVRCVHLTPENLCAIYEQRPPVCRNYRPDELCLAMHQLSPGERVAYFLEVYGLTDEAAASRNAFDASQRIP